MFNTFCYATNHPKSIMPFSCKELLKVVKIKFCALLHAFFPFLFALGILQRPWVQLFPTTLHAITSSVPGCVYACVYSGHPGGFPPSACFEVCADKQLLAEWAETSCLSWNCQPYHFFGGGKCAGTQKEKAIEGGVGGWGIRSKDLDIDLPRSCLIKPWFIKYMGMLINQF